MAVGIPGYTSLVYPTSTHPWYTPSPWYTHLKYTHPRITPQRPGTRHIPRGHTHARENITFPQLRWRAAKIQMDSNGNYSSKVHWKIWTNQIEKTKQYFEFKIERIDHICQFLKRWTFIFRLMRRSWSSSSSSLSPQSSYRWRCWAAGPR